MLYNVTRIFQMTLQFCPVRHPPEESVVASWLHHDPRGAICNRCPKEMSASRAYHHQLHTNSFAHKITKASHIVLSLSHRWTLRLGNALGAWNGKEHVVTYSQQDIHRNIHTCDDYNCKTRKHTWSSPSTLRSTAQPQQNGQLCK